MIIKYLIECFNNITHVFESKVLEERLVKRNTIENKYVQLLTTSKTFFFVPSRVRYKNGILTWRIIF